MASLTRPDRPLHHGTRPECTHCTGLLDALDDRPTRCREVYTLRLMTGETVTITVWPGQTPQRQLDLVLGDTEHVYTITTDC